MPEGIPKNFSLNFHSTHFITSSIFSFPFSFLLPFITILNLSSLTLPSSCFPPQFLPFLSIHPLSVPSVLLYLPSNYLPTPVYIFFPFFPPSLLLILRLQHLSSTPLQLAASLTVSPLTSTLWTTHCHSSSTFSWHRHTASWELWSSLAMACLGLLSAWCH